MAVCACYNWKNQPDSGRVYCVEALGIMQHRKIPSRLAEARLYMARNLTLRKQFKNAFKEYQQVSKMVDEGKSNAVGVELYYDLGLFYTEQGRYDSAGYSLHKALKLLKHYNNQKLLIRTYELLSKKHELTYQHDSSLYYFKLYSEANNENFNTQKSKQIASLQAQYDFKSKDKEIELSKQLLKLQFYIIAAIGCLLISSLVLGYFIYRIYLAKKIANEELQLLNRSIQDKNEEIVAQSEELRQASDEIGQMNENLETLVKERTDKIEVQNKKLVEYAYFNAHKVRGPLARILGLVSLIRMQDLEGEIKNIHERLGESARELDQVIHEINSNLENNENVD
jgi:methyl-accepting chemotaxis protein